VVAVLAALAIATFLSNEAVKAVITGETKGADTHAQLEANDIKTIIASPTPDPDGAQAYAADASCARTIRGNPAPLRYGTPRPTAPPVGWCLQRLWTLGRPGARRRLPPGNGRAVSARHPQPSPSRAERRGRRR
jgi:hypothetical protein